MSYLPWAEMRSKAAHEVGHFLQARDCGLHTELMTIDKEFARRDSGEKAEGFCRITGLHQAPIYDQVCIFRAGIVAADMIGLPNRHGGGGDFAQINKLLVGCTGDEHRAIVGRADRRAERVIRENFSEFERLVAELVAKKTISFEQPKPAPAARSVVTPPARTPVVPSTQIRRATMPLLERSTATSTSYNAAKNTLEVCFTTGEPVVRTDVYDKKYLEVLETGEHNVDLSRLNAGAPFLNNHRADSLDAVLGSVVSARMEGGRGLATIKLSTRKEVAGVVMDLADGIITGVSCGYRYVTTVREKERDDMPVWRVTRWQPYEVSACLIQADSGARVRNGTSHEFQVVG